MTLTALSFCITSSPEREELSFCSFFSSLPCYYFLSPVSTSSTPTLTGHCRHRKDDEDSPEARRSLRAQNDQSSRVKPPNKTSSISCFGNHCFHLSVETHTQTHREAKTILVMQISGTAGFFEVLLSPETV